MAELAPDSCADFEWSPERAAELSRQAVDLWAEVLSRLQELPVVPGETESEVRAALTRPVPNGPLPRDELLTNRGTIREKRYPRTPRSSLCSGARPNGGTSTQPESFGKEPAEARDFPGFVSNRILMPFINEAAYALMDGVAEAEAIDTIAKLGFPHPMGRLALADLIGLDTCVAIMEVLHEGSATTSTRRAPSCGSTSPPGDLVASPAAGSTTTTPTRSFDGRASGR